MRSLEFARVRWRTPVQRSSMELTLLFLALLGTAFGSARGPFISQDSSRKGPSFPPRVGRALPQTSSGQQVFIIDEDEAPFHINRQRSGFPSVGVALPGRRNGLPSNGQRFRQFDGDEVLVVRRGGEASQSVGVPLPSQQPGQQRSDVGSEVQRSQPSPTSFGVPLPSQEPGQQRSEVGSEVQRSQPSPTSFGVPLPSGIRNTQSRTENRLNSQSGQSFGIPLPSSKANIPQGRRETVVNSARNNQLSVGVPLPNSNTGSPQSRAEQSNINAGSRGVGVPLPTVGTQGGRREDRTQGARSHFGVPVPGGTDRSEGRTHNSFGVPLPNQPQEIAPRRGNQGFNAGIPLPTNTGTQGRAGASFGVPLPTQEAGSTRSGNSGLGAGIPLPGRTSSGNAGRQGVSGTFGVPLPNNIRGTVRHEGGRGSSFGVPLPTLDSGRQRSEGTAPSGTQRNQFPSIGVTLPSPGNDGISRGNTQRDNAITQFGVPLPTLNSRTPFFRNQNQLPNNRGIFTFLEEDFDDDHTIVLQSHTSQAGNRGGRTGTAVSGNQGLQPILSFASIEDDRFSNEIEDHSAEVISLGRRYHPVGIPRQVSPVVNPQPSQPSQQGRSEIVNPFIFTPERAILLDDSVEDDSLEDDIVVQVSHFANLHNPDEHDERLSLSDNFMNQYNFVDVQGSSKWGYRTEDQYQDHTLDQNGNMEGSFGWESPEGDQVKIQYVADKGGYRVVSSTGVFRQESEDVLAAKNTHLRAHENFRNNLNEERARKSGQPVGQQGSFGIAIPAANPVERKDTGTPSVARSEFPTVGIPLPGPGRSHSNQGQQSINQQGNIGVPIPASNGGINPERGSDAGGRSEFPALPIPVSGRAGGINPRTQGEIGGQGGSFGVPLPQGNPESASHPGPVDGVSKIGVSLPGHEQVDISMTNEGVHLQIDNERGGRTGIDVSGGIVDQFGGEHVVIGVTIPSGQAPSNQPTDTKHPRFGVSIPTSQGAGVDTQPPTQKAPPSRTNFGIPLPSEPIRPTVREENLNSIDQAPPVSGVPLPPISEVTATIESEGPVNIQIERQNIPTVPSQNNFGVSLPGRSQPSSGISGARDQDNVVINQAPSLPSSGVPLPSGPTLRIDSEQPLNVHVETGAPPTAGVPLPSQPAEVTNGAAPSPNSIGVALPGAPTSKATREFNNLLSSNDTPRSSIGILEDPLFSVLLKDTQNLASQGQPSQAGNLGVPLPQQNDLLQGPPFENSDKQSFFEQGPPDDTLGGPAKDELLPGEVELNGVRESKPAGNKESEGNENKPTIFDQSLTGKIHPTLLSPPKPTDENVDDGQDEAQNERQKEKNINGLILKDNQNSNTEAIIAEKNLLNQEESPPPSLPAKDSKPEVIVMEGHAKLGDPDSETQTIAEISSHSKHGLDNSPPPSSTGKGKKMFLVIVREGAHQPVGENSNKLLEDPRITMNNNLRQTIKN